MEPSGPVVSEPYQPQDPLANESEATNGEPGSPGPFEEN